MQSASLHVASRKSLKQRLCPSSLFFFPEAADAPPFSFSAFLSLFTLALSVLPFTLSAPARAKIQ
jgi:hypothetical protein